jgi:O-antigen/teichoic acid export membrane protein
MSTVRRIAKNTLVLFLAQIVSMGLGFFSTIFVARYLGAEGFGVLSFALAFAGIFGIFADLGLNRLLTREVARNTSLTGKYLRNVAAIKTILVGVTFGLIVFTISLMGYPEQTIEVVYFIALSIIFNALTGMFNATFQAFEEMEFQSIGGVLNSILLLAGILVAIQQRLGIVQFAAIYFIVSALVLIYSLIICAWKFVLPGIEIDWRFWRSTIKEALPFGLSAFFVNIYFMIDSVMLSIIAGNESVGWYNAAYRLIFALMVIPTVFLTSMFPVMSRHFKFAHNLLKQEYEIALKYLFIVAVLIFVYGIVFSDEVILIVYGNGYVPSIQCLQVLIVVIPLIFITLLFGNFLESVNKQRIVTAVTVANAALNVTLNLFLIPKFSYIGASAATVVTESLGFVLMFVYISRNFFRISIVHNMIKPLFCGAIVAALTYYLKVQINWLLVAFLGFFVYLVILYIIGSISKDDIAFVKQLFPKENQNVK